MTPADIGMVSAGCMIVGFTIDRLFHPGRKVGRRLEEFLEDWNGEPERRTPDGQVVIASRRPGIPERVANIEKMLNGTGLSSQLAELSGHLNIHIESADVVRERIDAAVTQLQADVDDLRVEIAGTAVELAAGQRQIIDRYEHDIRELSEANNALTAALNAALGEDG